MITRYLLSIPKPVKKVKSRNPPVKRYTTPKAASPIAQVAYVLLYAFLVSLAPSLSRSEYLLLIVLAARSLLFMPYVVRPPANSVQKAQDEGRFDSSDDQDIRKLYLPAYVTLALTSGILTAKQILTTPRSQYGGGNDAKRVLGAVNENPAVSALGYDFLLGLAGLAVHNIMTA